MKIGKNCVVSFDFTLTDEQGKLLDTSKGEDPVTYLHGSGGLIPGLEQAMADKEAGDSFEVSLTPEQGYGEVNPELIQQVPVEVFEGIDELAEGMQLEAEGPDGAAQIITIQAIDGEQVTINANPPLAGMTLNFDVTICSVREATDSEMDHGHVH